MDRLPTTVVVPTIGRSSLRVLLDALATAAGPRPEATVVVDDRAGGPPLEVAGVDLPDLSVVRSGGGGPARARNLGWRRARTSWVTFVDDDVVPDADWCARLGDDLAAAADDVHGSQGRVRVPMPVGRAPTDWERGTAGLASAQWITADMTYRRAALAAVGGFDERFPRAYREDADLGLRVQSRGGRIIRGRRSVTHPVRPADDWVSVRVQSGNGDDALMRRLHGRDWRERAGTARGRRRRHLVITAAGAAALALRGSRRPRLAATAGTVWLAGTAELAHARIAPGPKDADELRRMLLTSAAIPALASWHTARGWWRHRRAVAWRGLPELVLFDRDDTLVHDVPYNADPDRVEPVPGARAALDRLRAEGVRIGVVTNQSGLATGRLSQRQLDAVNARVRELLGPFDVWEVCPHGRDDGCECRKPAPGMVKHACAEVGVEAERCVIIGDIGSDVRAAQSAGAVGILVPTARTRPAEVTSARHVARDLATAVDEVLGGAW